MGRVFSECHHSDGTILFIGNTLATGCPNLLFLRADMAMFAVGPWCTWIFGVKNVSYNHFWRPAVKAIFSQKRFSSTCLMIWDDNASGLMLDDICSCENCALQSAASVSFHQG